MNFHLFFFPSNMSLDLSFLFHKLPNLFNLQLWILIAICLVLSFILFSILFYSLCFICHKRKKSHAAHFCIEKPVLSRCSATTEMDRRLLSGVEVNGSGQWCSHASGTTDLESYDSDVGSRVRSVALDHGWGKWYSLEEIEVITNGFSDENVIDSGYSWVVYSGMLLDNRRVAVKDLVIESENHEEFMVEIETIGHATHKNLVKLIGYSIEGDHRMLVYDYTDNGNLHQWLHAYAGSVSPLTWSIRMKIIMGTAKGLAYLHEDIEPNAIHRDLKSSNILLDQQWNPKIFDFGFLKLIGDEGSQATTHVADTPGYLAPEYASTGILTDKSDVYSFGVLIMEIISGRTPLDYGQPQSEVCLVDWVKSMVSDRKLDFVVDPKLPEMPDSIELKRVLLIALCCVDPDAKSRPKMGDVIHMLEPRDPLFIAHC
ncbi:probable serine/threonine-protein kinase At1g01540 [Vitis vinifera]|uniref:probable serine/threonine-protein kinase At1g01540 n=1 Tax=Vitis vinifera TaxID=29760 RepID=UPI00053FF9F0|nr:probable serine/threonine-protein kinase At1g01540 [Vitis vinifera]|eukprot:XP_010662681.1 PREDICTED: probable serine/threonine-protein kinase At1g01540 [Vitis vinifera]